MYAAFISILACLLTNLMTNFFYLFLNKPVKKISKLGDFNINLLKSENSVSNFLDILGSFSMLPQIILPTRITNTSKTLIGNIFTDSSNFQISSGNLTYHISDHLPQFSIFKNININYNLKHNNFKRNWSMSELHVVKRYVGLFQSMIYKPH